MDAQRVEIEQVFGRIEASCGKIEVIFFGTMNEKQIIIEAEATNQCS